MILIAGGTGRLGQQVVRLLTARGLKVRVLARQPERAEYLRVEPDLVEIVPGDVREGSSVERAMAGVTTVISAIHGFAGTGSDNPQTVDWEGNLNLIRTAEKNEVDHFILMSIHGAAPEHPLELFRMKHRAEKELRASALAWTVVRSTAFMELWADLIGRPLLQTGKTTVFGRGDNPINFVSVCDVARFIELAVVDPGMRGMTIEVGGPQNLSMNQFAHAFEIATGKPERIRHVPLGVMRAMAALMRPVNPTLARQIQSGVFMDTTDMCFDSIEARRRYPEIPFTLLADVVKREYTVD